MATVADPATTEYYKQFLNYGVAGIVLGYFIYQDYQARKRQAIKEAAEEARRAAREAADALNDVTRERDCVDQIRKVELARTTELKEYLFKHLDLQIQSNMLYERLIKVLENMEQDTRTYRRNKD